VFTEDIRIRAATAAVVPAVASSIVGGCLNISRPC
jgi:hypothetical protein